MNNNITPHHRFRRAAANVSMVLAVLVLAVFSSCSSDDTPKEPYHPNPDTYENVVLVYAVGSNNLYGNLIADKSEMLKGLKQTDPSKVKLLLLENIDPSNKGTQHSNILYEARLSNETDEYEFVRLKEFDSDRYATEPAMLTEAVEEMTKGFSSARYGIIFWSHGGGWAPAGYNTHIYPVQDPSSALHPKPDTWWGVDESGSQHDQMNIDELAAALPDNLLHFVWFDSCYMSGIELAYQLRNKARYLVAYPTEVHVFGLDYTTALPLILAPVPRLEEAARTIYNFYTYTCLTQGVQTPVTVGVFDLQAIGDVAALARKAFTGYVKPSVSNLPKYTRGNILPMYDFREYLLSAAAASGNELDAEEVNRVFSRFTLCKYASERNFSNVLIDPARYSGMSAHVYDPTNLGSNENFFRSLDWFKAAYE